MSDFEREVVLCRTLRKVHGGFIIETDGRSDVVCRTFDEAVKVLKRVLGQHQADIKKEEKEALDIAAASQIRRGSSTAKRRSL